jgi:hypothetical protein
MERGPFDSGEGFALFAVVQPSSRQLDEAAN